MPTYEYGKQRIKFVHTFGQFHVRAHAGESVTLHDWCGEASASAWAYAAAFGLTKAQAKGNAQFFASGKATAKAHAKAFALLHCSEQKPPPPPCNCTPPPEEHPCGCVPPPPPPAPEVPSCRYLASPEHVYPGMSRWIDLECNATTYQVDVNNSTEWRGFVTFIEGPPPGTEGKWRFKYTAPSVWGGYVDSGNFFPKAKDGTPGNAVPVSVQTPQDKF